MKRILVTGSSGYIGQHLCKLLKKNNFEVWGLDIHEPIDESNLDRFIPWDIRDIDGFQVADMGEYDTIIHLAALVQVGESVKHPTDYYDTNINGTLNLIKFVKHKKFIFASTGAAEGLASPYGISKRVAEDIVRDLHPDATIFRFYNVIGSDGFAPTNPDGLFYNLIKSSESGKFTIYGDDYNTKDGTCVREYVHVMDICHALMLAIDLPSNSPIENLAYGDTRTVREIADLFQKVNGVEFDIEYLHRRSGDLEACYLEHPSEFMIQRYSYEEMLKWKH